MKDTLLARIERDRALLIAFLREFVRCRSPNLPGDAVVYGPSPHGLGSVDENVSLDEFFHVVKSHVLSAFDYLSRTGARGAG